MEKKTLLSSAGIAMVFATATAVAQPPPGYGGPLYPGQVTNFGSSRPTHVDGRPVPFGATGYSPLPGSGVQFNYGGGGSFGGAYSSGPYGYGGGYSSYPREIPYGGYSSYPREVPFGGYSTAPREVPLGGGYGRMTYGGFEAPSQGFQSMPLRGYSDAPLVEGPPPGYRVVPVERAIPLYAQVQPQPAPQQPAPQVQTQPSEVSVPKGFTPIQDRTGSRTTAINDQPVPAGAVGYRLDSKSPGGIQWSYKNGTTTADVLAKAPAVVEKVAPAKRSKLIFEWDFDAVTAKLARVAALPDVAKKNRTEAISQLATAWLDLDVAPVGADAEDTKALDDWVKEQFADKAYRLQALFQLGKPTKVASLSAKQSVWFGRCSVPWADNREDAGAFAFYPDGNSASVTHSARYYDPKTGKIKDAEPYSTVEALTPAEVAKILSVMFEYRNENSKLNDADGEVSFDRAESPLYGGAIRVTVRRLTIGKTNALVTQLAAQKDGRGAYLPVSHCLFGARWEF